VLNLNGKALRDTDEGLIFDGECFCLDGEGKSLGVEVWRAIAQLVFSGSGGMPRGRVFLKTPDPLNPYRSTIQNPKSKI